MPATSDAFTPVLPAHFDVVWTLTSIAVLALFAVALVAWFTDRGDDSRRGLDLIAILLVPVIGPIAFLVSRHLRSRAADHEAAPSATR